MPYRGGDAVSAASEPLTIAEILDLPALVPIWPTVGRALGLAQSTTYQLAAEGRLPEELRLVRLGRTLKVRTSDLITFLGLETVRDLIRELQATTPAADSAA